jgi:hypothetical protein
MTVAVLRGTHTNLHRHPAAAVRAARPGWRMCAAGCGWPVDPAAAAGGFDRHPGCERPRLRLIKGAKGAT